MYYTEKMQNSEKLILMRARRVIHRLY